MRVRGGLWEKRKWSLRKRRELGRHADASDGGHYVMSVIIVKIMSVKMITIT